MNRVLFKSQSHHWSTPSDLYDSLDKEFKFDDDPCPLNGEMSGLLRPWGKSTYVNPPYGRDVSRWINKAILESEAGKTIVMLLPVRTDTRWFQDYVIPYANEIRFLRGRLTFGNTALKNPAPFPSMIIIFQKKEP